jgi:hypothetical protein
MIPHFSKLHIMAHDIQIVRYMTKNGVNVPNGRYTAHFDAWQMNDEFCVPVGEACFGDFRNQCIRIRQTSPSPRTIPLGSLRLNSPIVLTFGRARKLRRGDHE